MASSDELTNDASENGSEMSSLEWVTLQSQIDKLQGNTETFWQKAGRRTLENPIAPIGLFWIQNLCKLTVILIYF